VTASHDPSAGQVDLGGPTTAGRARLDRTSEFTGLADGSGSNGDGGAEDGTWQSELWRRLARRPGRALLAGLAAGVLVAMAVGVSVSQGGSATYTSQTVMLLDDPLGIATSGDAGVLVKMDDLRYKYASLASTDAIAAPVAATLHVPASVVLGATSVQVPANSLLLDVDGTWSTPGFARALSTAMAQGIIEYIQNENSAYDVPSADRFVASIVSPAGAASPSQPSHTRAVAVGVLVLVLVGTVVFTAFQLLTSEPVRRRRA
jgi:capsular polysaccharide biosynthesis protein